VDAGSTFFEISEQKVAKNAASGQVQNNQS
jgi:hypothetical protein